MIWYMGQRARGPSALGEERLSADAHEKLRCSFLLSTKLLLHPARPT